MALREELHSQGNWLFRWRSYLPLLIFPILIIALRDSEYLERAFGDTAEELWEGLCLAVSMAGLAIRCLVIGYVPSGTSGRNTKQQIADTLNTTGMYSIVRNPLYLGNFIMLMGVALLTEVWWFTIIATLGFWLYYERIIFAEEEFLRARYGQGYLDWASKAPAFIPRLRNWQRPSMPFSFRNVLKREYSGFFGIIATFFVVDILADVLVENRLELRTGWEIIFGFSLLTYLALRTLKKKTALLNVEGR